MALPLAEILEKLADLLDAYEHEEAEPNPGENNFRCTDCDSCYECRFCVGCTSCERCTYCEGCEECVDCTHCKESFDLAACSHCEHSRACRNSRYLTLCFDCDDCTQCFACVGLEGQEFCLLNEQLEKREYFRRVKALRGELERRAQDGFLPAFEDDPEAWFDVLEGAGSRGVEEEVTTPFDVPRRRSGPDPQATATRGRRPTGRPDPAPTPPSGPGPGRSAPSFLRTGRRPPRS